MRRSTSATGSSSSRRVICLTVLLGDVILGVVDEVIPLLALGSTTVMKERGTSSEEVAVTFQPGSGNASPIVISTGPHALSVFVEIGEATTVELTEQKEALLRQELLELLTSITEHGFTERTWRFEGEIVHSEAEIPLKSGQIKRPSSQLGRRRLRPFSNVVERTFLPYAGNTASST